jgi:hypothetical protein
MAAVTIPSSLLAEANEAAQQEGITVDQLVAEALRQRLKQRRHDQFEAEARAFEAMHARLLKEYHGQFVAIYNGQVIDHDPDKGALYKRVRRRLGRTPVYFQQVTEDILPTFHLRSPRKARLQQ